MQTPDAVESADDESFEIDLELVQLRIEELRIEELTGIAGGESTVALID